MNICIVNPEANFYYDALSQRFPQFCWHYALQAKDLSPQAKLSQVLLASPSEAAQLISEMPNLDWVHSTFAGIEPLLAATLPKHYQLTNSRDVFGPLMSEYVFSHLLKLTQQHQAYAQLQQQCSWQALVNTSLQQRIFCCIGSGNISQHLAKTAAHFGMSPIAVSLSGQAKPSFTQVVSMDKHHLLTQQADVVVAVLPNTPQTRHLLSHDFFEQLRPDVIFINVGRGATVDQAALLDFLNTHPTAQAIIDVTSPEPLPKDHPLWLQNNCTITPHIAAPSRVIDIARLFADNLATYSKGLELRDKVDFRKGY